ncbi:hypothetical protein BGW41_004059 [Actinomortierella wolfii]|nr:hypothetical protein BGW41_004059 [Actinomortierella wolfii]
MAEQPSTNAPRQNRKRCAFFTTPQGCRHGDKCTFAHVPASQSTVALSHNDRSTRPRERRSQPQASKATARQQSSVSPSNASTQDSTMDSSPSAPQAGLNSVTSVEHSATRQPQKSHASRPINPARVPVRKPLPKSLSSIKDTLSPEEQRKKLREFELNQIKSRYGSSATFKDLTAESSNETVWRLSMVPTDPDFPYEIDALEIQLHVPNTYPKEPAWLEVMNHDIPKGFARNLEKGFAEHARKAITTAKSLLAQLSWLDVNMETLLQQPPAPTIRFVSHASTSSNTLSRANTADSPAVIPQPNIAQPPPPPSSSTPHPRPTQPPRPSWTPSERQEAALKRQQQLAQLQTRFRGSLKVLSDTSVEIALEPTNAAQLPVKLEGPLLIHMLIPSLYPLEPCSIQLGYNGANPELEDWRIANIEKGFEKIVASAPAQAQSLFQYLSQLNRSLKDFMLLPEPSPSVNTPSPSESLAELQLQEEKKITHESTSPSKAHDHSPTLNEGGVSSSLFSTQNDFKHGRKIYHIPAPSRNFGPEEEYGAHTSEDSDDNRSSEDDDGKDTGDEAIYSADDSEEEEDDVESDHHDESPLATRQDTTPIKRGVEIRMPDIILEHISLLHCTLLNLLVRCNRCKSLIDIPNLKPDKQHDASSTATSMESDLGGASSLTTQRQSASKNKQIWKNCDTCLSPLGAHFRPDFIHMNSRTLGYLDLAGCTAYDILPSTFVPTCDGCDHVLGADVPGGAIGFRQQVGRGMSATANCRNCHLRLVFSLEGQVRFVKLAPGDLLQVDSQTLEQLPLKKKKGKGGTLTTMYEEAIKVGEPLPKKGACEHYKKSRRWFRFPCCSKVYPCHLCHDEKESSHEAEFAKRMICGNCAREQPISDKPCQCGQSPVRSSKPTSAFWEGGEGVRDKTRMSTKDPRKYKGSNKTVAKKQVGAENVRKRREMSKKK